MMSTKFQVGTAAVAVAAAASLTPVIAHAAPSIASFTEGLGNSAEQLLQPVVVSAAASATPVCTTSDIPCVLAQTLQGVGQGLTSVVVGFVTVGGSVVYATLAITGGVIKAVGDALPGPIGDAISAAGQAFITGADNVARVIHIGPYSTAS
ncbi:hypothetical protein ACXDF8_22755 [Mycolicibacterium sp. CBM1]